MSSAFYKSEYVYFQPPCCAKVSLLVVKKLINMMALGAGFKVPPEEVGIYIYGL